MTDPLRESFANTADGPTAPTDAPTTEAPGAFVTDTPASDTFATDAPAAATDAPAAGTSAPGAGNDSLTPLYAAAGLAEVVMTTLRSRLSQAQAQAKGLPAGKGKIADLQQQLRVYRDQVASGYTSLATRGKPTVDSTLVTVRHLSGRAERKDVSAPTTGAETNTADQVPSIVVQPVVVEPTNIDRTPGAAG
ncbi:MAG TPA: hypothetical protein VEQ66_06930 [Propionibacteriaceae bacterium]|nr:hypothetical protein [Propionibacteriaceae bacterium]